MIARIRSAYPSNAEAKAMLDSMDKATQKIFRKRGVRHLASLFHQLAAIAEAKTLVECGAREAETSIRFVEASNDRRAFALEANPETFGRLTRQASRPNLFPIYGGVGANPGELILNIPLSGEGDESFLRQTSATQTKQVLVPVTTLDLLTERFRIDESVALWVDVEGFAREVLAGGAKLLLNRVKIAMVEVETTEYWHGGAQEPEIRGVFAAFDLVPVARDVQRREQFNVIFLHKSLVPLCRRHLQRYAKRALRPVTRRERLQIQARRAYSRGIMSSAASGVKSLVRPYL